LPDYVKNAETITLRFYAGSRQRYNNSTSSSIFINILVDEIELLTDTDYLNINEHPDQLTAIKLFPNPTTSSTTLTLELDAPCNITITLTDVLGNALQEIFSGYTGAGNFEQIIESNGLAKGVYFVKVKIGGKFVIEKLVVN
jgi:hypothetical protein